MKKRGQVTIFVILGLVVFLLVFLAIMFLFQEKEKPDPVDIMSESHRSLVQPIERDISYCLEDVGQEALKEIGLRGGHLIQENTMHNLNPAYSNNAVELISGSDMIIPFWAYYDGAPDCLECQLIMDIPELEGKSKYTIQSQVQNYINENMRSCVNNFEAYNDFDVNTGEIQSQVIFASEGVSLKLDWPINIMLGSGENLSLNKFSANLDINFKKIYELSKTLFMQMMFLDEDSHLEKSTMHMLELMSIKGENSQIPPVITNSVSGTTSYKFWLLSKTKEIIKNSLQENLNYVQIKGSKDAYYPATNNVLYDNIYREFEFNPIIDDYEQLSQTKIRTYYFEHFPTYLKIFPGRELITPQKVPMKLPIIGDMGHTLYEYSYDLMYPVVLTLEDENAYEGEGYTFHFATTVNIFNNAPKELDFENLPAVDMREEDFSQGGFGSLDQRTVPVKLRVVDGYTGLPIKNIPITYSCGNLEISLGNSQEEESYEIDTMVPPCVDGTFYVERHDALSQIITQNILIDEEYEFDINIYLEKEVPISIKTLKFSPAQYIGESGPPKIESTRDWRFTQGVGSGVAPHEDEEIMLMLSRINENERDTEFFKLLNFNDSTTTKNTQLVPGLYEVILVSTINLGDDNITINEKNYTVKTAEGWAKIPNFFKGDSNSELVTLPEIEFNETMFLGTLELKKDSAMILNKEDVMQQKEIRIIYPTYDFEQLKYHQDLDVLAQINNATTAYPESFGYFME